MQFIKSTGAETTYIEEAVAILSNGMLNFWGTATPVGNMGFLDINSQALYTKSDGTDYKWGADGAWTEVGGGGGVSLAIGDEVTGSTTLDGLLYTHTNNGSTTLLQATTTVLGNSIIVGGKSRIIPSTGNFSMTAPEKNIVVAGVDDAVYYAQVSLSSAQILALNTTPVQLVAAPGAGKYIVPIHMSFDYTYGTTAYATATIQTYETSDKSGPITSNTSFLSFTTSIIRQLYTTGAAGGGNVIYAANQPLMIYATVSDPILGDGTAKVNIYYKIVTQ